MLDREAYDLHHGWSRRYQMIQKDLADTTNENIELKRQLQLERSKRVRLEREVWVLKNRKR